MRNNLAVVGGITLFTAVLTGCPSLSTMHTARPIEVGKTQIGLGAAMFGAAGGGGAAAIPTVELQVRHGINETMDFGAKIYPVGVGADLNIMLVDTGAFALSVDPGLNAIWIASGDGSLLMSYLWLPILADVVSTKAFTLTLGPKLGYLYVSAEASGNNDLDVGFDGATWLAGGMIGMKLQFTPGFGIMPEFDVVTGKGGGAIFHGALNFLF